MTLVKDLPVGDPARGDAHGVVPAPTGPAPGVVDPGFFRNYPGGVRPGLPAPATAATNSYDTFGNPLGSVASQATDQKTGQWIDRTNNPIANEHFAKATALVDAAATIPVSKSTNIDATFNDILSKFSAPSPTPPNKTLAEYQS